MSNGMSRCFWEFAKMKVQHFLDEKASCLKSFSQRAWSKNRHLLRPKIPRGANSHFRVLFEARHLWSYQYVCQNVFFSVVGIVGIFISIIYCTPEERHGRTVDLEYILHLKRLVTQVFLTGSNNSSKEIDLALEVFLPIWCHINLRSC